MKAIKLFVIALIFSLINTAQAQTADKVIANHFENTGGIDAWNTLKGLQINATMNQQGFDIPVTIIDMKDGRQLIKINIQGQDFTQLAFDGNVAWTTNFQTQKAEKLDDELLENFKTTGGKNFPSPFLNYKKKGFTVEYLGEEIIEGINTYKVSIDMDPIKADGETVSNKVIYYFDTENYVPILTEREIPRGPTKGQIAKDTYSDYTEVDGLYFAFTRTVFGGQPLNIKSIKLNPEVTPEMFAFPE